MFEMSHMPLHVLKPVVMGLEGLYSGILTNSKQGKVYPRIQ